MLQWHPSAGSLLAGNGNKLSVPHPIAHPDLAMKPVYCATMNEIDADHVGGKAANLFRLRKLGIRVPKSFVVTRRALRHFLSATGFEDGLKRYLRAIPRNDRHGQASAFAKLSEDIQKLDLPADLRSEMAVQADALLSQSPNGLAVRSSGIYEDSDRASFAGVFESFLCVRSLNDLIKYVKQCWCAAWSPLVLKYCRRMDVDVEPASMAVLIQDTLCPDVSGVVFTADSVTGDPWHYAVNSTYGLLQAVMDGASGTDHYVLDWNTGAVLEQIVVAKKQRLVPGQNAATPAPVEAAMVNQPSLSYSALRDLQTVASKIDQAFDTRMDIEWAFQDGSLFIVQARPITALPTFFPHKLPDADRQLTWQLQNVQPVEPLSRHICNIEQWSRAVPEGLDLLSREGREIDVNGHRYVAAKWVGVSGGWLEILERRSDDRLSKTLTSYEEKLNRLERKLRRVWLDGKKEMFNGAETVKALVAHTRTARDLIPDLLRMLGPDPRGAYMHLGAPQTMGSLCEMMLKHFLRAVLPDYPVENLLVGMPSYSHERLIAAQQLARSFRDRIGDQTVAQLPATKIISFLRSNHVELLDDLERYCWKFGLLPPSWDNRPAKWTDSNRASGNPMPEVLSIMRKTWLSEVPDLDQITKNNAGARREAEDYVRRNIDATLLPRFDKLLKWARFWLPIFDDRLWVGSCWGLAFLELLWHTALRLTAEGILRAPEDISMLDKQSLERFQSGTADALRRSCDANRGEFEKNRRLTPLKFLGKPLKDPGPKQAMPMRWTAAGQSARRASPEARDRKTGSALVLSGIGRAPGKPVGQAKVLNGLSPGYVDSLADEHILVLESDMPFRLDWLAIFLVVKGLVTYSDCGAGLHHAAQIAREFGVAYVEMKDDRKGQIPDGATIEIDGQSGRITIGSKA